MSQPRARVGVGRRASGSGSGSARRGVVRLQVNDAGLKASVARCSSLTSLNLTGLAEVTDDGLKPYPYPYPYPCPYPYPYPYPYA